MSGTKTWSNISPLPSSEWTLRSPRSLSPQSRTGEPIFHKYLDIIHSKPCICEAEEKQSESLDRPFDFFDDEEFAFGINLLNNNVACVGENMTKLIQMAQEPWPDNVKLFQPYEVEQILLPDNASCLAVQAFLKMCNLPFEVEMRWNAEFMSPSGRVPFIKCGAFVVSELEPIVQFAANKGVTLCSKLSTEEKAEMRAYMSLITNVLVNAELYISWIDNDTYNAVSKVRNSSVYPWPLGWLQTRAKRNAVAKRLKALHWHDKTLEQVLSDVEQCCNSLSQRLGDRDYFFGTTPTALDALMFGHIRALLSASGPKAAALIKPITTSLLKHVVKMVHATGMSLTPQEEYLLTQAFQVTRRRLSPERTISDRSSHARKSRLKNSRDNINYNRDMFGFKPFASKQTIIMSKEGALTCKYDANPSYMSVKISNQNFAIEIIEDILDKVEELAVDDRNNLDEYNARNDFEIVYSNDGDGKFRNVLVENNDLLDTIEETAAGSVDGDSVDQSIDASELFHIIHDDDLIEDSDGMVNDKHLACQSQDSDSGKNMYLDSEITDSSKKYINENIESLTVTSSGGRISESSDKSDCQRTTESSGSKTTLKMASYEEISVESLLKYLRERNAAYGSYVEVADID